MCNHGQFYVSLLIKAVDFFYIVRREESVSSARSDHRLAETTSVLQEAKTVADCDFVEQWSCLGHRHVHVRGIYKLSLHFFLTYPNIYTFPGSILEFCPFCSDPDSPSPPHPRPPSAPLMTATNPVHNAGYVRPDFTDRAPQVAEYWTRRFCIYHHYPPEPDLHMASCRGIK